MEVREHLKQSSIKHKERNQKERIDEICHKYLTFTIDGESYGIEIQNVMQIIGMQDITYIPEQEPWLKGVINLRGQIIPVMEVRTKFKKDLMDYDDRTCIIVVSQDDMLVGLIVDRVSEVLNIQDAQIAQTPRSNGEKSVDYVSGIVHFNHTIIRLLDIRRMLNIEG